MSGGNSAFMAGVPELLILKLLSAREMYGYELAKAVQVASGETLSLGEGVLYPVLHGLEAGGALRARTGLVSGRRRIYYSLTVRGRRRLQALSRRWQQVAGAVDAVMGGAHA
ncbi:MAG TPA: PadR family transcriptional regulator [Steroidobacteraceae bacterium]|jgi:PadR family transcriptional regulator PadR|nr:PadR family transcriptional regulator [Steroidobacteraceae bacterium]